MDSDESSKKTVMKQCNCGREFTEELIEHFNELRSQNISIEEIWKQIGFTDHFCCQKKILHPVIKNPIEEYLKESDSELSYLLTREGRMKHLSILYESQTNIKSKRPTNNATGSIATKLPSGRRLGKGITGKFMKKPRKGRRIIEALAKTQKTKTQTQKTQKTKTQKGKAEEVTKDVAVPVSGVSETIDVLDILDMPDILDIPFDTKPEEKPIRTGPIPSVVSPSDITEPKTLKPKTSKPKTLKIRGFKKKNRISIRKKS